MKKKPAPKTSSNPTAGRKPAAAANRTAAAFASVAPPKAVQVDGSSPDATPKVNTQTEKTKGKRLTLSLRVTREQYKTLIETRLTEESTLHDLLAKSVSYYLKQKHGLTW
jgi:hypothetical protein